MIESKQFIKVKRVYKIFKKDVFDIILLEFNL